MRRSLVYSTVCVLVFGGCASDPDDLCVTERKLATNRIALNRIALNKLAANALLGNALPEAQLTSAAIDASLGPEGSADEFVQSLLEYTVSCALAPEQSLAVRHGAGTSVYEGSLGLAPVWAEAGGTCDETCQGWVSACLIARSNFLGESVPISLLGDHPGLAPTEDETAEFDVEEATYFGDLFGPNKSMYACVPAGASGPERTCGADVDSCTITVLGECNDVCDAAGCRGADGRVYSELITVRLSEQPSCL